jgi:tRNA(Ile)-lysidine synthase
LHLNDSGDWGARFRRALERGRLLRGVERLLIAVSGGPDSTALFLLFLELRSSGLPGFPELLAGHVHHGLRGDEADRDEAFVRALAAERGLECLVARAAARDEAARAGLSPEAAARSVRYRAFREWASERRIDAIALAHHLDDQAETVLFRALRGTGWRGLAGMPRRRRLCREGPATRIIRPLLGWRRQALLDYLREKGQPYRLDHTNDDPSVPRNFLRLRVIPLLEAGVHPGAPAALARLGRIARRCAADVALLGRRAFAEAVVARPWAGVFLDVAALRAWPATVLHEVFRLAIAAADAGIPAGPGAPDGSRALPEAAYRVLRSWLGPGAPRGARFELGPAGRRIVLELRYGLIRALPAGPAQREDAEVELAPGGGPVAWGGWTIEAWEEAAGTWAGQPRAPTPGGAASEERFAAGAVAAAGPLRVRARFCGDLFQPLGAPGRKALTEFLRERRVWPADRGLVPLVVAGEDLIWVVGERIAEPFRVRSGTDRVLAIRATPPAAPADGRGTKDS